MVYGTCLDEAPVTHGGFVVPGAISRPAAVSLPVSPPSHSRSARRLTPGLPAVSLPVSPPSRSRSARRLARQQEQGVGGERGVVGDDAPADHRLQVRAAEPLAAQVLLLDLQVRLARGEA